MAEEALPNCPIPPSGAADTPTRSTSASIDDWGDVGEEANETASLTYRYKKCCGCLTNDEDLHENRRVTSLSLGMLRRSFKPKEKTGSLTLGATIPDTFPLLTSYYCAKLFQDQQTETTEDEADRVVKLNEIFSVSSGQRQNCFGKERLAKLKKTDKERAQVMSIKISQKSNKMASNSIRNEVTLLRKLQVQGTPFFRKIIGTFQTTSGCVMVTQYTNRSTIKALVEKIGVLSITDVRFYTAEITCALGFLHDRRVIHRSLSSDNVALDMDGHVVITDLAFVSFLPSTNLTLFDGPPYDYIAPEMVKGLMYDKTVDWWSLGVIAYFCLYSRTPFNGLDDVDTLFKILKYQPTFKGILKDRRAMDFCRDLLVKKPRIRLGAGIQDAKRVKAHPFFNDVNWEKMEARQEKPPRPIEDVPEIHLPFFARLGMKTRLKVCETPGSGSFHRRSNDSTSSKSSHRECRRTEIKRSFLSMGHLPSGSFYDTDKCDQMAQQPLMPVRYSTADFAGKLAAETSTDSRDVRQETLRSRLQVNPAVNPSTKELSKDTASRMLMYRKKSSLTNSRLSDSSRVRERLGSNNNSMSADFSLSDAELPVALEATVSEPSVGLHRGRYSDPGESWVIVKRRSNTRNMCANVGLKRTNDFVSPTRSSTHCTEKTGDFYSKEVWVDDWHDFEDDQISASKEEGNHYQNSNNCINNVSVNRNTIVNINAALDVIENDDSLDLIEDDSLGPSAFQHHRGDGVIIRSSRVFEAQNRQDNGMKQLCAKTGDKIDNTVHSLDVSGCSGELVAVDGKEPTSLNNNILNNKKCFRQENVDDDNNAYNAKEKYKRCAEKNSNDSNFIWRNMINGKENDINCNVIYSYINNNITGDPTIQVDNNNENKNNNNDNDGNNDRNPAMGCKKSADDIAEHKNRNNDSNNSKDVEYVTRGNQLPHPDQVLTFSLKKCEPVMATGTANTDLGVSASPHQDLAQASDTRRNTRARMRPLKKVASQILRGAISLTKPRPFSRTSSTPEHEAKNGEENVFPNNRQKVDFICLEHLPGTPSPENTHEPHASHSDDDNEYKKEKQTQTCSSGSKDTASKFYNQNMLFHADNNRVDVQSGSSDDESLSEPGEDGIYIPYQFLEAFVSECQPEKSLKHHMRDMVSETRYRHVCDKNHGSSTKLDRANPPGAAQMPSPELLRLRFVSKQAEHNLSRLLEEVKEQLGHRTRDNDIQLIMGTVKETTFPANGNKLETRKYYTPLWQRNMDLKLSSSNILYLPTNFATNVDGFDTKRSGGLIDRIRANAMALSRWIRSSPAQNEVTGATHLQRQSTENRKGLNNSRLDPQPCNGMNKSAGGKVAKCRNDSHLVVATRKIGKNGTASLHTHTIPYKSAKDLSDALGALISPHRRTHVRRIDCRRKHAKNDSSQACALLRGGESEARCSDLGSLTPGEASTQTEYQCTASESSIGLFAKEGSPVSRVTSIDVLERDNENDVAEAPGSHDCNEKDSTEDSYGEHTTQDVSECGYIMCLENKEKTETEQNNFELGLTQVGGGICEIGLTANAVVTASQGKSRDACSEESDDRDLLVIMIGERECPEDTISNIAAENITSEAIYQGRLENTKEEASGNTITGNIEKEEGSTEDGSIHTKREKTSCEEKLSCNTNKVFAGENRLRYNCNAKAERNDDKTKTTITTLDTSMLMNDTVWGEAGGDDMLGRVAGKEVCTQYMLENATNKTDFVEGVWKNSESEVANGKGGLKNSEGGFVSSQDTLREGEMEQASSEDTTLINREREQDSGVSMLWTSGQEDDSSEYGSENRGRGQGISEGNLDYAEREQASDADPFRTTSGRDACNDDALMSIDSEGAIRLRQLKARLARALREQQQMLLEADTISPWVPGWQPSYSQRSNYASNGAQGAGDPPASISFSSQRQRARSPGLQVEDDTHHGQVIGTLTIENANPPSDGFVVLEQVCDSGRT